MYHPIFLAVIGCPKGKLAMEEAEKAISQIEQGLIEFRSREPGPRIPRKSRRAADRYDYAFRLRRRQRAGATFSIGLLKKAGDKELNVGIGSMDKFSGLDRQ
jgi:hypothetical protein